MVDRYAGNCEGVVRAREPKGGCTEKNIPRPVGWHLVYATRSPSSDVSIVYRVRSRWRRAWRIVDEGEGRNAESSRNERDNGATAPLARTGDGEEGAVSVLGCSRSVVWLGHGVGGAHRGSEGDKGVL